MVGYNGGISSGYNGPNGEYEITNVDAGYQPPLSAGTKITFNLSGQGGGFDANDFDLSFHNFLSLAENSQVNTTPTVQNTAIESPEGTSAPVALDIIDIDNDSSQSAAASFNGVVQRFNAFFLEDFVSTGSSDTQGRFAAGGDVTLNSYGIASNLSSQPAEPTLIVGGDLNYVQGKIFVGSALVGGSVDGVNETVTLGLESGAS